MPYEYKRRRPSIIRNFWVYRRLIGTAVLLGLMLWFIMVNHEQVTVALSVRPGQVDQHERNCHALECLGRLGRRRFWSRPSSLPSGGCGARKIRKIPPRTTDVDAERPPADYAAKTTEGFSNAHWSN